MSELREFVVRNKGIYDSDILIASVCGDDVYLTCVNPWDGDNETCIGRIMLTKEQARQFANFLISFAETKE